MRKKQRHSELKSLPGTSPRILSRRLHELERNGLVSRSESKVPPEVVVEGHGEGLGLPILFSYVAFDSKRYPDVVFTDG